MRMRAYVAGIGMTSFGNHLRTPLKRLAGEAITLALRDAGLDAADLEAAYMASAAAGLIVGQGMISGQVVLRELGIGRIPVLNIENACASASSAFNLACAMVSAGHHDVALVCGYDKLYHEDRRRTFAVFNGAVDAEDRAGPPGLLQTVCKDLGVAMPDPEGADKRSAFMDIYAVSARYHMQKWGTTPEQFAAVSAKNSYHGSLNPMAQFRDVLTVADVLAARTIVSPLTLPMCSPIGDGAAAVVVISERKARQMGLRSPVRIVSSVLGSGWDHRVDEANLSGRLASAAYEEAGIGPADVDCIELHDASAPSEIMAYEHLGLCPSGGGGALVESGSTTLGGRQPVNTSGGLLRKGHPVGATGAAQICELALQLQGRAGDRQVSGARIGLAHNAGGSLGTDAAAAVVTLLQREELR